MRTSVPTSLDLTAYSLQPNSQRAVRGQHGFSLLELLVAITVLIVIVMVTALIFQQASVAWGTGTRKAGAETNLRAVMGTIERDLAMAVDDTPFGGNINSFNSSSCSFVTLDGSVDTTVSPPYRMPQKITYSLSGGNVTRTVFKGRYMNPTWDFSTQASSATLGGGMITTFTCSPIAAPANGPAPSFPLRVEIEAHATKSGQFAIISGWSKGRGKQASDRISASL